MNSDARPLAIDLYCGLGGWTEALLARGYRVIGYDVEAHRYGEHAYPAEAELRIADVRTLNGADFADAALIVASPPCQEFSYMAMPWKRGKQIGRALRGDDVFPDGYRGSRTLAALTELFDACFRIQAEACEAAGRHVPMVVENVNGAQAWVGKADAHYGSFYLWGDVPVLMPTMLKAVKVGGIDFNDFKNGKGTSPAFNDVRHTAYAERATKNEGGSWFNIDSPGQKVTNRNPVHGGQKIASRSTHPRDGWFYDNEERNESRRNSSGSTARKAASARIAKIPASLAACVAEAWWPALRVERAR